MSAKKRSSDLLAGRRDLCPGPSCGEPVVKDALLDRRERPWHRDCAVRALSDYFRTPLDLSALDGESVEYEVPGEHVTVGRPYMNNGRWGFSFRTPRDFALLAVRLGGDFGLHQLFVGDQNVFCCAPTDDNAVFGDDLDGRLLRVGDLVAHKAVDITVGVLRRDDVDEPPSLTLVGALFDPARRRGRRSEPVSVAVGGLRSGELVMPGETVEVKTATYARVRYGRLAVDDHGRWNLERVRICAFAADARSEMAELREVPLESRPLGSRVTKFPVFTTTPGEWVALTFRNCGPTPVALRGRLIGEGFWRDEP